jgi:hypothetical protein
LVSSKFPSEQTPSGFWEWNPLSKGGSRVVYGAGNQ